jgi:hypothetical protein
MADRAALERLLHELKLAATPIGRVKLLGRAWRVLRRLDPGELRVLATEAGLDHAEGLLERLARGRGKLTPGIVLPLLKKLRGVDAHQVDEVVRSMRDPGRRDELMRDGLEAVEQWLEPTPEPSPPPSQVSQVAPVAEAIVAGDDSRPVDAPAIEPVVSTRVERTPVAAPVTVSPPVVVASVAVAAPSPPAESETRPVATPRQERKPVTEDEPHATPDAEDFLARLSGETQPMRRLRLLREELECLRGADVGTLEGALESFHSGWSRRRALSTLLSAGIPASLMHAVYLIEQLASPGARRWCTGALLDHRQLTPDERHALAERHGVFRHRRITRTAV